MKIRRIVVGLGVGPESAAALATLAALAALHDAQLEALFVEGDELARLAALPFAKEMGFPSAAPRRLDPEVVERSLRARAQEARRALASTTGRTDPRWSFRIARGSLFDALLAASPDADLIVIGSRPWDPAALQLVREGVATLLILPAGAKLEGPLLGICSGASDPVQAASTLCALADAIGDGISVLVAGSGEAEMAIWQKAVEAVLQERGREATVGRLPRVEWVELSRALQRGRGVIALLGVQDALGEGAATALLRSARIPVFVCRG